MVCKRTMSDLHRISAGYNKPPWDYEGIPKAILNLSVHELDVSQRKRIGRSKSTTDYAMTRHVLSKYTPRP